MGKIWHRCSVKLLHLKFLRKISYGKMFSFQTLGRSLSKLVRGDFKTKYLQEKSFVAIFQMDFFSLSRWKAKKRNVNARLFSWITNEFNFSDVFAFLFPAFKCPSNIEHWTLMEIYGFVFAFAAVYMVEKHWKFNNLMEMIKRCFTFSAFSLSLFAWVEMHVTKERSELSDEAQIMLREKQKKLFQ